MRIPKLPLVFGFPLILGACATAIPGAYSRKQQTLMILLSLIALPILYLTLELPKQIVNNALNSERFPIDVFGRDVDQVTYLILPSGLYLVAIILIGINKYALNVFKGYVAERFLRRIEL